MHVLVWKSAVWLSTRLIQYNLAAVWPNFQAAGAGRLLLCRVLEERSLLRYVERAAPGCSCTVVRLRAPLAVAHARIRVRENSGSADRYLNVAAYLTKRLDETRVEDILLKRRTGIQRRSPTNLLRRAQRLPY